MKKHASSLLLLFMTGLFMQAHAMASTLDVVKKRGYVTCGVSQGLPGFSNPDDTGAWQGIDVDLCKAIAAAIFGDANKTKFLPLSAKTRFTALQSGEIDVLTRNTTWSLQRDAALGVDFPAVNFYDGQGFMVAKDLGVSSVRDLNGASICVNAGTTTELNAADFFRTHNMDYEINTYENSNEALIAYDSGRCDAYTSDLSGLAAQRLKLKNPEGHIVLPEIISKEPLGPLVREGDNQWADVVRWSFNAMLAAEELGVNSANVQAMKNAANPPVRRLLGTENALGEYLGLPDDWAFQIIKQVGNYGESYDRTVGKNSPLQIPRKLNALWTNGGLQYAPPIR
ncbi:MAG: amino acid ABC transporter substrate-binding protein [Parvibaculales bacterium]